MFDNAASPQTASLSSKEKDVPAIPRYAEVAVSVHVFQTFTYGLNNVLAQLAQTGARIVVPLGRKLVTGYIVELLSEIEANTAVSELEIKDAVSVLDSIPVCTPEILELTKWVADYYSSPWGETIKAALPPGISPAIHEFLQITAAGKNALEDENSRESISSAILKTLSGADKPVRRDAIADVCPADQMTRVLRQLETAGLIERTQTQGNSLVRPKVRQVVRLVGDTNETKLTDKQKLVTETLSSAVSLPFTELAKQAGVTVSTIRALQKKGVVEISFESVRRDPFANTASEKVEEYHLTKDQTSVLEEITRAIEAGSYSAFLLHGVTGSGKTEVYIRAMRRALELGKSAMMLVPEIALTPVFSRRLRAHFGSEVAIFHSSLQRGERFDEWNRVRNGEARIVIGTRSAVFAPVKNLGLIVIDEEHEGSYRQQESPYYNGRDTAIVRARSESATVVLGSATPSLESFHNSKTGKYAYLSLPERIGGRPMAEAKMIDMRNVFAQHGTPRVFSDELLDAIRETYQRAEQSIILLNRRGFSSYVLCRSCGETIQCPNCDVTLTFHRHERVMICHYCNHRQPAPRVCPSCNKTYIHYVGEGTEQLEVMLSEAFPDLRIARIDRDTTANRRNFERVLLDFSERKLDMLVGTQMLAKGHDFPNVTLVGVVSVDAGLALPDFRAGERTFQLITQVAGRAGRGDRPGRVLIQTYHPYHYALRHACAQDYEAFYNEEIRYRQNHSYPPYVALASLLVHGKKLDQVRADALQLRKELDSANSERTVRILGPAPAPLARLKGEHRFQILLKSRSRRRIREVTDVALNSVGNAGINLRSINLEIDPISMM